MIAERLKAARERAGLDQVEVAVALGFHWQAAVSNIKRGRSAIGVDRAAPAAKLLGVSTDYLLGVTDDPTPVDQRGSSSRIAQVERHGHLDRLKSP